MKRLTIRARLTLVYGSLFVLCGIILLAVTYALIATRLPRKVNTAVPDVLYRIPFRDDTNIGELREALLRYEQSVRESAINTLMAQGGIALVLVATVAIGVGWLLAGRALQPLNQITGTARRIASAGTAGRGLHERIVMHGPRDEVRELADTINIMLERLDRSFDGQRRLVANASHELRTPLAINRALLELAVTRPDASADTKRLAESLLEVNERHERLVDGLLTLADAENEVVERSPVDLAEVAGHVLDQLAVIAEGAGIEVVRRLRSAPTAGDPVLLERLAYNLVENAIRHNTSTADRGWLCAQTAMVAGVPTLEVSNTGPVVPGYEVDALFQPFRRLGHERVGGGRGFGLGMSIVRGVARAHGGEATALPREGGGLTVTVRLPAAS